MHCLICGRDAPDEGVPCKLCGMKSLNPVFDSGFDFCCEDCSRHFMNIIESTPDGEIDNVMEKSIII